MFLIIKNSIINSGYILFELYNDVDKEGAAMGRKVVLYIATSIDGYIADKDGKVGWLGGHDTKYKGDYGYQEFIKTVDTVIMGMTTYNQLITVLSPNEWVYKDMRCYVFTHQIMPENENVNFISGDIMELIQDLKKQEGKNIWICGGANIINQMVTKNMIDEYYITIMPVILGGGISLFTGNNPGRLLKMEHLSEENGVIQVSYSRRMK